MGAEGGVQHQGRKGKAEPQQRGVPAETGRQMERHGQQGHRRKDAFAPGGHLHGPGGQGGKEEQVGQPAQSQRRGEAQMEKVGHKHRRTAGQIEQRILVGLQLGVFLVAVEGGVGGGEQRVGELPPGEHRGVLILQGGVHVGLPAETGGGRHMAHLPPVVREKVRPPAGQRKALVDVVFFVGGGVGGQHKAVEHPQPQHQHKDKAGRAHPAAAHRPDGEGRQQRRKAADQQEKPCQVAADTLPGYLDCHGAVHLAAVQQHGVLPQGHAAAVADGQYLAAGVVGRQRKLVPPPGSTLHFPVQTQHGVLVGQDVAHHAGGAGQFLAGVGVGEHHFQFTLWLTARQIELHPHGQQILVEGEGLAGGLAVLQDGGSAVVIADGLRPALAQLGAHQGQPHQHRDSQQHHQGGQRPAERRIRFFQFGHARHTTPPVQSSGTPKVANTASFQRPSVSRIFCTAPRTAPWPPFWGQM